MRKGTGKECRAVISLSEEGQGGETINETKKKKALSRSSGEKKKK